MLPKAITDFFDVNVIRSYKRPLVGTNLIARGADIPIGTKTVSRDKVANFTGKAKRGYNIRTIPRETGERTPKSVIVIEHAYGYDMHKDDLAAYARIGESALNGEDARQSGRLVGESLDDVIFNGDPNSGAKGIYKDASLTPYDVTNGYEWDTNNAAPDKNIVEAIGILSESGAYDGLPMKLTVSSLAYAQLIKRIPNTQASYLDYIAKLFPNGTEDIYKTGSLARDEGLLSYYGVEVAERNVEKDINTYAVNGGVPDKDNMINFNVDTKQATDVKHTDAFLPLTNLLSS